MAIHECTECSITDPLVFRALHFALWNIHRSAEDHRDIQPTAAFRATVHELEGQTVAGD
jgi:hypothetical protein